jgi:hypothetical protein
VWTIWTIFRKAHGLLDPLTIYRRGNHITRRHRPLFRRRMPDTRMLLLVDSRRRRRIALGIKMIEDLTTNEIVEMGEITVLDGETINLGGILSPEMVIQIGIQ